MKILITGGAGFIGSHLCRRLLREKHTVICVDNFLTGPRANIKEFMQNKAFRLVEHDVIKPLPSGMTAEIIFHLASPASPNHHSKLSYHAFPMETMLVNTIGTLELLKFAEKNRAKFLFASSSEVYGDPTQHPQTEEYKGNVSTTGPRSIYDEAKRFGETITAYFVRARNVDARIARIFNTYGPGLAEADMRMIVAFIDQALRKKPLTVFGDGTQTRSLCYIDDTVEGLIRLMFSPNTKGEVVNIGSQEEHSVLEYVRAVKKITNSESKIVFSEKLPEDDPMKRRPNIEKAKKILNWKPKIHLEEGLQIAIKYYKTKLTIQKK